MGIRIGARQMGQRRGLYVMKENCHATSISFIGRLKQRAFLFAVSVMVAASTLAGCATDRLLPIVYMPTPPKECEQVLGFKVDPLPTGKSNAAALSVAMAKEGAARQQEHSTSKVCAEYALRTAGVMKDKDKPRASGEPAVLAATTTPVTGHGPGSNPATGNTRRTRPVREDTEPTFPSSGS